MPKGFDNRAIHNRTRRSDVYQKHDIALNLRAASFLRITGFGFVNWDGGTDAAPHSIDCARAPLANGAILVNPTYPVGIIQRRTSPFRHIGVSLKFAGLFLKVSR